jgi:S-adenosylmethionine/arginine decarboxylase-like enzyme
VGYKGFYELSKINKHLLVKGFIEEAPGPDYVSVLHDWFLRLVDTIDMKILMNPHCIWCDDEGNEGVTGVVGITTSHSSIHFWPEHYMFDLYSCKEFEVETVVEMLKEFKTHSLQYQVINRDTGEMLDEGFLNMQTELVPA